MVNYDSNPEFKITITTGGTDYIYENDQFIAGQITRVENGLDIATLYCNDFKGLNYPNKITKGSKIKVEFKDAAESSWVIVFNGIIRFIDPLHSDQGEIITLKCDGTGYGLAETLCGAEYGTESNNPGKDTVAEILGDEIIPKWVNKVLGTSIDSGYNYTVLAEYPGAWVGPIRYLYFPFKPCLNAINDVMDIAQAIKGTSPGPHWIVRSDDENIWVKLIGNSFSTWTKYYKDSQSESTLEQGKDFTDFRFQELTPEANYVLYHGAWRRPSTGDVWTENRSEFWAVEVPERLELTHNITDPKVVGTYCIKAQLLDVLGTSFYTPNTKNAAWNFSSISGPKRIPFLNFYMRRNAVVGLAVHLSTSTTYPYDNRWSYTINIPNVDEWIHFSLPVGPYYGLLEEKTTYKWIQYGSPDWANINCIIFDISGEVGRHIFLDGLHFGGVPIIRVAKRSGAFTASDPVKMKIITDDVGKDDSCKAADDSGIIAQLAKAELLRAKTTPTIGYIKIPLIKDLLPGQFVHIHAKKKTDGTFGIDKDFRVTKFIHSFGVQVGFETALELTDDLINANARSSWSNINKIFQSQRPEFQDRQATNIKASQIDINQSILEKSY